MYCRYCGKEIDDLNSWCNYCGKPTGKGGAAASAQYQSKPADDFFRSDDLGDASYDATPAYDRQYSGPGVVNPEFKKETSTNAPAKPAMIVLCVLFPLAGIVLGALYCANGNKQAGKVYVILSTLLFIFGTIFWIVICAVTQFFAFS